MMRFRLQTFPWPHSGRNSLGTLIKQTISCVHHDFPIRQSSTSYAVRGNTVCDTRFRGYSISTNLPVTYHRLISTSPSHGCDNPGTVEACLNKLSRYIKTVPEAERSAELIIAQVMGHKTLYSVPSCMPVSDDQWNNMKIMANRRHKREPVQYILGEWDFRNITLHMFPPVFIPRPETEQLVGYALQDSFLLGAKRFLEIGSGSGAISLSLLQENKKLLGIAIEQGQHAFELTKANASLLKLEGRLKVMNLNFKATDETIISLTKDGLFDFIISNPPYILEKDMKKLDPEISRYEDHKALCGGVDGLDLIREMLLVAPRLLKPGGSLWIEVDDSHPKKVEEMVHSISSLSYVSTYKDFNELERFCHVRKS